MCDDQLKLSESPEWKKRSIDTKNSEGDDQTRIKASNFYSQKKAHPCSGFRKNTPKQPVLPVDLSTHKKVKISSKAQVNSKPARKKKKITMSVNKPVGNVFGKKPTCFFNESRKSTGSSPKKVSVGKIKTSPILKDISTGKRRPLDLATDVTSQTRLSKKAKFDANMNIGNSEDCTTENETTLESNQDLETDRASLIKKEDIIDLCDDNSTRSTKEDNKIEIESNRNKDKLCVKRQSNLDGLRLASKETKTHHKQRDSGCQENFRILEESPQDNRSPALFSPGSSSSGFISSSSNSRTCSPDNQSSITKYFSPMQGDNSKSPSRNANVTPDKKGKRNLKTRKDISPSSPISAKKEQMYLDFGQRDFGHVTCSTCNMVYTRAQPEDEADHLKFHLKFVTGLRFLGWKTERVVEDFDDGRVIVVLPRDHFTHLKKVVDVRKVVDNELGFSSESSFRMQDAKTYMFIIKKKVVGCVVAVDIHQAYPVLPSELKDEQKTTEMQGAWCCSSTPVRAQCGISRVWVLQQYRRQGIATRLLDCARKHFMLGCVIAKETLAFSDPTPNGKQLAESYFGTKSFLVFR